MDTSGDASESSGLTILMRGERRFPVVVEHLFLLGFPQDNRLEDKHFVFEDIQNLLG